MNLTMSRLVKPIGFAGSIEYPCIIFLFSVSSVHFFFISFYTDIETILSFPKYFLFFLGRFVRLQAEKDFLFFREFEKVSLFPE